ncbi:MAG: cysteine synthase A [Oscillospiraceae bacterium]|nr:cysteine synthase A [Oscillospiraceae bacterium]
MRAADSLTELIGRTPLLRPGRLLSGALSDARLYFKLEMFNPAGSVKDRIAYSMITRAEQSGALRPGATIIEPSSGNTGIGVAFVAACRGYKVVVTMPDTMSAERRSLLGALGALVVLTPGAEGMKGAVRRAEELQATTYNSVILQQFENPANPEAHYEGTANEIWDDTDGLVDIFVAGVGTGGTVTGVGRGLKEKKSGVAVVAVEPFESQVLGGGAPGPHRIQGIGAGFVPKVFDRTVVDEIFPVRGDDAVETARTLGRTEGLLAGISSGAAAFAALRIAGRSENRGKVIVALLPDTGERYLSTQIFS